MKAIPLTQGQFAIVDDYWFDYLSQWKWRAVWCKDIESYYAVRTSKEGKTIYMHRIVAKTPQGMVCDHIHHKTLDNRECELRNVTPLQSNMNVKLRKDNQLGIKGVQKTAFGRYTARLAMGGKSLLHKNFPTLAEAMDARKNAERTYFGVFAHQD